MSAGRWLDGVSVAVPRVAHNCRARLRGCVPTETERTALPVSGQGRVVGVAQLWLSVARLKGQWITGDMEAWA